jgi:uncharacterized protein (DUF2141 family)
MILSCPAALLLAGALFASPAAAQGECTGPKSAVRLYVNVSNVNVGRGLIAVTLYPDDRRRFLAKRGSLYVGRVQAEAPATRVCIYVPGPGTYALAVYHDADSSRKFNRHGIGMPAEGFGFSNNPPLFLSMPAFSRVRISVDRDNMETNVRLRYP